MNPTHTFPSATPASPRDPGPVVLITGALAGIGRATALAFAREGARLIVSGRHEPAGHALVDTLRAEGAQAEFIRADVRIEKSAHVGFLSDTSYYRLVVRCDGQPLWDEAYTPAHGDTQSPFITLAERA